MPGRRSQSARSAGTETRFLNVDLDIVSRADLSALLGAFGKSVTVLRDSVDAGVHTLWLELYRQPRTIDQAVLGYVALVESLPRALRRLWNEASDRSLNIGIRAESKPQAATFDLAHSAL